NAVKVRHNTAFDAKAVKQQLGISVSAWDDFMYRLRTLSERKVRNRDVQTYFQRVFAEPGLPFPTKKAVQSGEVKTPRAMQQVLVLFEGRGRGADLPSAKCSAYGLLNAVT